MDDSPNPVGDDFTTSIRGFPPCKVNPKRNVHFNIYKFSEKRPPKDAENSFHHPYDKLSKVVKQKQFCCDSWAISVTSCLSDIYSLKTVSTTSLSAEPKGSTTSLSAEPKGSNPELEPSFILSCYSPKKFSKYYTSWGCNGDTVYNAIYFLYTNGTIRKSCWNTNALTLDETVQNANQCTEPVACTKSHITCPISDLELFKIGESDLPGTQPDACNISSILTKENKLTLPNGNEVAWESALNYLKYWVNKNPVIVTFIVLETFLYDSQNAESIQDWHINDTQGLQGVYFPEGNRKIVGFHSAVVVGYDVTSNGVPYWILRNSWGAEFGPNGDGYWKHAMYPKNIIGAVDISIDHLHPKLLNVPFMYKRGSLGGMVAISSSNSSIKTNLNISQLKHSPYIREFEEQYPIYIWIVFMILLILIIGKMLNT